MAEIKTKILLRNDTKTAWLSSDPVLGKGEIGIEIDTGLIKIGDAVKKWSELSYFKGDLSNYYTIAEVESLVDEAIKLIPDVDLSGYYTKEEVDAQYDALQKQIDKVEVPVVSVNGKTGAVVLDAEDISSGRGTVADDLVTITTRISQHEENKNNPHNVTAEQVGAYSMKEVDELIDNVTIDNLDADMVTFDKDLVFTKTFGKYVPDKTTGSVTIPTATDGMSLKDLLLNAFSEETDPSVTDPAVSFSSVAEGSKEVGTEVTLSYTASLSAGSYTYGPATGITAKTWEVSVANIEGSSKLTTNSSNFGKVTVKDGDSAKYKITAKATYDAGAMPVTNLGNDCPAKQIAAGSKSKTSSGLTGYRAWFHCYRPGGSLIDINSITSDTIRNNIGSDTKTKWVSKNGSFTSSLATTNMQQIFFAAPAGVVKSVAVAHSVNGAPQTVLTKTIYVKGAGNYVTSDAPNGMAYDLFYVSNDNPNDGSATYTITVTKN